MSFVIGLFKKGLRVIRNPEVIKRGDNLVTYPLRRVYAEFIFQKIKTSQTEFVEFLAKASSDTVQQVQRELDELDIDFDPKFRSALYMLVRLVRPNAVVETGVAEGKSSLLILKALEKNGIGKLYSIDLPSPSQTIGDGIFYDEYEVGRLVPADLRERWELILGDARDELPKLLDKLGNIDIFIHDSLHTEPHMMWEYKTAWEFIPGGGILMSDDIGTSFLKFCREKRLPFRGIDVDNMKKFGGVIKQ